MSSTSSAEGYILLASQVGGHPGVKTSEDGSILIKPALPVEVHFYQSVGSDPNLEPLRPFIPHFYGTLRLEGQVDPEQNVAGAIAVTKESAEAVNEAEKDSIVLENLSHTFSKPNILDVKLGTVLYDESASEEKRARMEKTARETTSLETGIRLTGFQVYDLSKGVPINTPKSYGKSIKASDLPEGITRFFPLSNRSNPPVASEESADLSVAPHSDDTSVGTGLPADILLPILECLREDIAEIREALSQVHIRMVGGSFLVVYEADWDRAREGLKLLEDEDDEDEDEDEDDDDENVAKKPSPPYVVKLIDFAHTHFVPGKGPDEGVLLGVDTFLRLIDGRIEQVKALMNTKEST